MPTATLLLAALGAPPAVVAGAMPEPSLIALSAASPATTFLIESKPLAKSLDGVLAGRKVLRVDAGGLEKAWSALLRPEAVVVCPATPRPRLLQAAALAAALKAPLWVSKGTYLDTFRLTRWAREAGIKQALRVGDAPAPEGVESRHLPSAREVADEHLALLARAGKVTAAVVCNPHDDMHGSLSSLGPWLAARQKAALLLTGPSGDVSAAMASAQKKRLLRRLETVTILATHEAAPVEKRANPIPEDKDKQIEMEPLTPKGADPASYAVGRLFHADRAVLPLMLARQEMAAASEGRRKALVASNPGGGLPLLEAFSRCTARELAFAGYDVQGLYGRGLDGPTLRKAMRGPGIVLWEGHHNTLVKDWGFTSWDEPMAPSLVVLQSCLALQEEKVRGLLTRGPYAVVGTSTRTYSGSGGAFSLSFLSALAHEKQTLGESLRHAKNFLVCCALLKEKRLGEEAEKLGANHRAAWAFSLWGDPTFTPPGPLPAKGLVRHRVSGSSIVVEVPEKWHEQLKTARYQTVLPPNGRLAGLVRRSDGEPADVVPLVFREVSLPKAPDGTVPRLSSRIPSSRWVFNWDARRKAGWLLILPRSTDRGELRFRVEWEDPLSRRAEASR
jgi:hypothetical protein